MRAFMSDRAERLPISATADPLGFCGQAHANAALHEARRILAVTEPRSTTDHVTVRLLDPRGSCAIALADSLRAFVEE